MGKRRLPIGYFLFFVLAMLISRQAKANDGRDVYDEVMAELSLHDNRLPGSPAYEQCLGKLESVLAAAGLKVHRQTYDTEVPKTLSAHLIVGGSEVLPIYPLAPNGIAPPTTWGSPVQGQLVYVGDGSLAALDRKPVEGSIAVMEIDSPEPNMVWNQGARALVLVGNDRMSQWGIDKLFTTLPIGLPRVYVDRNVAEAAGLLTANGSVSASLDVSVVWQQVVATNLWVKIEAPPPPKAANPDDRPQALVLSATLDTFGAVPDKSPQLRWAANTALLAQITANLAKEQLRRSMYAVFLGSHYAAQDGARHFYYAVDRSGKSSRESLEARERDLYRPELDKPTRQLALVDPPVFVTGGGKDGFDLFLQAKKKLIARVNDLNYALRETALERRRVEKKLQLVEKGELQDDVSFLRTKEGELLAKEQAQRSIKSRYNNLRAELTAKVISDKEGFAIIQSDVRRDLERKKAYFERMIRHNSSYRDLEAALCPAPGTTEAIAAHFAFDFASSDKPWMLSPFGADAWSRSAAISPTTFAKQLNAYREVYDALGLPNVPGHLWMPDSSTSFRFDALATPHQRSVPSMTAVSLGIAGFQLQTVGDPLDQDEMPVRAKWDLAALSPELTGFLRGLLQAPYLPAKTEINLIEQVPLMVMERATDAVEGLEVVDLAKGSEEVEGPAEDALIMIANLPGDLTGIEPRYLVGNPNIVVARPGATGLVFAPHVGAIFPFGTTPQHINAFGFGPDGSINRFTIGGASTGSRASLHYGFGGPLFTPFTPSDYNFAVVGRPLVAESDSDARNRFIAGFRNEEVVYQDDPRPFKFLGNGLNLLGSTGKDAKGAGFPLDPRTMLSLDLNRQAAGDYAALNLERLKTLRSRNIVNKALEKLLADAQDHLDLAAVARSRGETRLAAAHETVANVLGHRVHQPLRDNANDLVQAVVILLILTIPFAFSVERLLFGFTVIYQQIAGFVGVFLSTFAVLYVTHPAFSLAAAPNIVFLAFVIILLSAFVIRVVMIKFKQELYAMQGLASKVHGGQAEGGTTLAAVAIGISGMRNRPLKTFLTATTVALLTFTILVFASFTSSLGVVKTYLGAARGPQRIEFHTPSFLDIPYRLRDAALTLYKDRYDVFFRGASFKDPMLAESKDDVINVAKNPANDSSQLLDAILVVDPAEVPRLDPLFLPLAEPDRKPGEIEVTSSTVPPLLVPRVLANKLAVSVGSVVTIRGQDFRIAQIFDGEDLKRLENVDGTKVVPPNFEATFAASGAHSDNSTSLANAVKGLDVSNFLFSSPDLTAITTFSAMSKLGALNNMMTLYPKAGAKVEADARELSEFIEGPIAASTDEGAVRFFFTKAVEGSGAREVIVPLLLGGLIILSSLLGSIVDRQKEIFTMSALGLAPPDVGALFFAESSVFAVVGGMGGYLISQVTVKVLSILSGYGLVDVPNVNFSSFSSIVTILIVMATVMLSTIYPARVASRSANPGVLRKWKMPEPRGDEMAFTFPFTVSADNVGGVIEFIREHFQNHGDASLGAFAAREIRITKEPGAGGALARGISAEIALAPFDLGVSQRFAMTTRPSDIAGIDEVVVRLERLNGAPGTWVRSNRAFIDDLREQFLRFRSLPLETILHYQALAGQGAFEEEKPTYAA
jgi:hypothetical protein